MAARRLLWHLLPGYLLVTLVSLAGVALYGVRTLTAFHESQRRQDLGSLARVTATHVAEHARPGDPVLEQRAGLRAICAELALAAEARLTVVAPDGTVLCDSERDPATLDNHGDRPEIREAFGGRDAAVRRFSSSLEEDLLYVAAPFPFDGARGAVRYAVPVRLLGRTVEELRGRFALAALAALALVALVSLLLSRRIAGPLRELRAGAERFARGEFEARIPALRFEEFAVLAEEMNRMAGQLGERIRDEVRQRRELEAVLSSMVEGVLAFDREATLLNINRAAADLLGIRPEEARGRSIQEAVRNPELQGFVTRTLAGAGTIEGELSFFDAGGERSLQAHGTVLLDFNGTRIGALVVLNDVTGLRRLERIRREFVANASHEIRTPVTSIKGFIETLEEGAIDDPEEARRFLAIMKRNADRLHSLIEDLLNLSRIEREAEQGEIPVEEVELSGIVREAVDACSQVIAARGVQVVVDCETALSARVSAPLLVQALVNLLDNAVKYSGSGGEVRVRCGIGDGEVTLRVEDDGPGIPREHLPRLFERFYRVDKARSRALGGTGLGLAIVKHIVQAHRGEVSVESEPGKGSAFTIRIPASGAPGARAPRRTDDEHTAS